MLTPSKLLWTWPLIVSGASTPRHVEDRRHDVDRVVVLVRSSPLAFIPAGHEMMQGSDVPPLNS